METPDSLKLTFYSDVGVGNSPTNFCNILPYPLDLSQNLYEIGIEQVQFESIPNAQVNKPPKPKPPPKSAEPKLINGPIGPQTITVWETHREPIKCLYPSRKNLKGFVSAIGEGIMKAVPQLDFKLSVREVSETQIQLTVKLSDNERFLELSRQLAKMLGFSRETWRNGTTTGKVIDLSVYDEQDKPSEAIINLCKIKQTDNVQVPAPNWGYQSFVENLHNAIASETTAYIGIFTHDLSDRVYIDFIVYEVGEGFKLSSQMNALLEFEKDQVVKQNTFVIVPKKNFLPIPPPPIPPPPFDADKFVYILCDLIEPQIVGDRQFPVLATLSRDKNKKSVSERFPSVHFLCARRQVAYLVRIQITDRLGNPLPSTPDSTSSVTLWLRRAM